MSAERSWRIEVSSSCAGSGICVATAPRYFRLVEGRSQPVVSAVTAGDDLVMAAAELCPTAAIVLHEEDTAPDVTFPCRLIRYLGDSK